MLWPADLTNDADIRIIRAESGKSLEYLIRVSENSRWQFGILRRWQDRIGSFPSLAAANKLVNSTLAQNASTVNDVAAGRIGGAKIEAWFKSPTGYESCKPISKRKRPFEPHSAFASR